MSPFTRSAQRCRERAETCRRLAYVAQTIELRDSYLRLAMSHEVLADSVDQLDSTEHWFAVCLARASQGIGDDVTRAGSSPG